MYSGRSALIAALVLAAVVTAGILGCASPDPLNGTAWKLTGWTISSIDPASVPITMKFEGGQISGNSGVNSYGGPYSLGPGNAFAVGALASTEIAGPELNMRAESAFMTLLTQARSYKLAGDTLTLYDSGGNESLIFGPAAK